MSNLDPTDIRARDKVAAEQKARQDHANRVEADDIKWLMSHKQGRRIVWGLLEKTGLYRSSFTGNSETFFREGARNVGLQYMALIHEHAAEKYNLMVTEQRDNDHRTEQR